MAKTVPELLGELKAKSATDVTIEAVFPRNAQPDPTPQEMPFGARCGGALIGITHDLAIALRKAGAKTDVPTLATIEPD